jgi:hypothetical protein
MQTCLFFASGGRGGRGTVYKHGMWTKKGAGGEGCIAVGREGGVRRSGKGGDVGRRELLTAQVGGWGGFQNFTLRD